ncbi:protein MFI-like [Liolophura sinensis]|uniref:protein MFI-like n=1 Tax=Liolophura sinensis TaxID=3198878 RepID=UPI00315993D7
MFEDIPSHVLKDIVDKSQLKEGTHFKALKLSSGGKFRRQELIKLQPRSDDGKISATIEIQRVWRGYRSRCKLFDICGPRVSNVAVYGGSQHHVARLYDFSRPKKSKARLRLEQYYKNYVINMRKAKAPNSEIALFDEFCVNFIQNWWKRMRMKADSEKQIQEGDKSAPPSTPKCKIVLTPAEAASIIQRTWRRHIDIQVYRYYRDLINFKTRGEPSLMLRCINPNEAKLLDPGLGVHVRFRLAGTKFPPNIYYKIFTHRPIIDMCANSPKDYTKPAAKKINIKDINNKTNTIKIDKEGWYERVENNGWRQVSDRLIQHIMNDPLTWESSRKKINFHHNKLQRRQDLEKKKKAKKIQWMKNMYKDGLLKAKSEDKETIRLIEGAAAGMVATVDREGFDALEEWEVDELLDWTTSLNFEEYMTSWKEIATSANSEKPVEDRLKVSSNNADPFELTLSVEPSAHFSPRQSARENTPASLSEHILQMQT